jgi:hypothetical protein
MQWGGDIVHTLARRGGLSALMVVMTGGLMPLAAQAQAYTGLAFSAAANMAWAVNPAKIAADFPEYRLVPSPCVTYTTDASSGQYVTVTAIFKPNPADPTCKNAGFGNLIIQGNTTLDVPAGAVYRFKARLSTPPGATVANVRMGVGFEVWDGPSNEITMPPDGIFEPYGSAPMDVVAHHLGRTVFPRYGKVLPNMQPRLNVTGLAAGKTVTFNIHSLGLEKASLPSTGILPLTSGQSPSVQDIAVAQPLKLTVNLLAANLPPATYVSRIRLVSRTPAGTAYSLGSHTALSSATAVSGLVVDPWQVTMLPVPSGTYDLYYRLATSAQAPGQALTPVGDGMTARADGLGGQEYRIGALTVAPTATMAVGNAFHDYPLRGSAPPVKQDFVRSLANSLTTLGANFGADVLSNNWWYLDASGNVQMAWDQGNLTFDRWADTFAPTGAGRKLLITFYGSPLGVGENDQAKGGWGASATGFSISAPKEAMLAKYGEAVNKTVTRYKGRVAAVECWNEPDSVDHYVGTPTRLADFCAVVSQQAKAADPDVKVICPQAAFLESIGYVMSARTSNNEPIGKFCDFVGAHLYSHVGNDRAGQPYSGNQPLSEAVREMRLRLNQFPETAGKPLAVTEFGTHECTWWNGFMPKYPASSVQSSTLRGQILYQSLLTLKEMGVKAATLYSYNTGGQESVNGCPINGGYSWQYDDTNKTPVTPVINQINNATATF